MDRRRSLEILAYRHRSSERFYITGTVESWVMTSDTEPATIKYSIDGGNTYISVPCQNNAFEIDINPLSLSTMAQMFEAKEGSLAGKNNFGITSLDFSHAGKFNNVTNTWRSFASLSSLTSIVIPDLSQASLTDCGQMFSGCILLTSLDLTKLNTTKITASVTEHGLATLCFVAIDAEKSPNGGNLETVILPQFPNSAYAGSSPFGGQLKLKNVSFASWVPKNEGIKTKFYIQSAALTEASIQNILSAIDGEVVVPSALGGKNIGFSQSVMNIINGGYMLAEKKVLENSGWTFNII